MFLKSFVLLVALAATAASAAGEPKTRQVTFLPLGKMVHARVTEYPGTGIRTYVFPSTIDATFAKLLVEEREPGCRVASEDARKYREHRVTASCSKQ